MRSILVPVNFTANSANAANYAADLALAIGADLHLIYIFELPVSIPQVPVPDSVIDEMWETGLQLVNQLKTGLSERTGGKVSINATMQIGRVEATIDAVCFKEKSFLVVMGATGHSLETLIDGSNAARAVTLLQYPVLVIPANARFHAIRKIVVACDREDIDSGLPDFMSFLKDLSELLDARLEVVHVLTNGAGGATEFMAEYNIWKKEVEAFQSELHFVRRPKVDEGLNDYLATHEADWLMVFPKRHSVLEFHRSRAKQIVQSCPVPVISVHE